MSRFSIGFRRAEARDQQDIRLKKGETGWKNHPIRLVSRKDSNGWLEARGIVKRAGMGL
jgi:hypothetical protein